MIRKKSRLSRRRRSQATSSSLATNTHLTAAGVRIRQAFSIVARATDNVHARHWLFAMNISAYSPSRTKQLLHAGPRMHLFVSKQYCRWMCRCFLLTSCNVSMYLHIDSFISSLQDSANACALSSSLIAEITILHNQFFARCV